MADIASKVADQLDKAQMLKNALVRIIQLYTDKSHFVYELLQNAEDAGATRIKFIQHENELVVLHDGRPFTEENLVGLCGIGMSDKIEKLNQIGQFGVGFKSVYGICETVKLFSQPNKKYEGMNFPSFAVEIRNFTEPVDISFQEIDARYTTKFVFPYCVGEIFSGYKSKEELNRVLSERLKNLGITTLLFMKSLKKIEYVISTNNESGSGVYELERAQIDSHFSYVYGKGKTQATSDQEGTGYLLFSQDVEDIQSGRTVDIAFAVSVDKNGDFTYMPAKSPYISVYFPTSTKSELDFIVQGPYRTTPNREGVPADDAENIRLARKTAELLHESILRLKKAGKLNFTFLNILPVEEGAFETAPLFKCMFDETIRMLKNEEVMLCRDGKTYASANEVKISRGNEFAEVFTDELLTELINDGTQYHWLPTFLTETNTQYKSLYSFLTTNLRIEVMRPESMKDLINDNDQFMPARDNEWLVKLYDMYSRVGAAFSKEKGASKNMLTAKIVKTDKGTFCAPYRKTEETYIPNVFIPSEMTDSSGEILLVDDWLYRRCKHFFVEILNLKKPDGYEVFVSAFKKRQGSGVPISDDQRISDLKNLLYYRLNKDYQEEVEDLIENYVELRCHKNGVVEYVNPHSYQEVFFSKTESGASIEMYFKNITPYYYVDEEYYKLEDIDRHALETLGVISDIAEGRYREVGEYQTDKKGKNPEWRTSGDFRWKLTLRSLNEVLEYISRHPDDVDSMAKSAFIFRFLLENEKHLEGIVKVGKTGKFPDEHHYSKIVETIRLDGPKHLYYGMEWDGRWIFTKDGILACQKDISKLDMDVNLYGEPQPSTKIYEMLDFDLTEDAKDRKLKGEYEKLSEEEKNTYLKLALEKYGLSIEDLENIGSGHVFSSGSGDSTGDISYDFPSSQVNNWYKFRSHTLATYEQAVPVKYVEKMRRIRTTRPSKEIDAYLRGMYRYEGTYEYACQMCHEPIENFERTQLMDTMTKELPSLFLCLCPECAFDYRRFRSDENQLGQFLRDIRSLSDDDINEDNPVSIDCGSEEMWFTQTHAAEIRELLNMMDDEETVIPEKEDEFDNQEQNVDQQIESEIEKIESNSGMWSRGLDEAIKYSRRKQSRRPIAFSIMEWFCPVSLWSEILKILCGVLYSVNPRIIERMVDNNKSRKMNQNLIVSKKSKNLKKPYCISGTNVWIETHSYTINVHDAVLEIVKAYGIPTSFVRVYYGNSNGNIVSCDRQKLISDLKKYLGINKNDNTNDAKDLKKAEGAYDIDKAPVTFNRPVSFSIESEYYSVRSWKTLLQRMCSVLYEKNPEIIENIVDNPNTKMKYKVSMSRNKEDMLRPYEVFGSDIWVETNRNASDIRKMILSLLDLYEISPKNVKVYLVKSLNK